MHEKLIRDQKKLTKVKGSFGPLGSVAANGCGFVALYNLMKLLGKDVDYDTLLAGMCRQWWKSTVAGGWLGSNPLFVWKTLKGLGNLALAFYPYFGKGQPPKHKLYLCIYFYLTGAHYSVAEWTNGRLQVYNDTCDSPDFRGYYHRVRAKGMFIVGIDEIREI